MVAKMMLHFKRSSILSKKKEPSYSFCLHKHYCKAAKSRNKIHCDCGENSNEPLAWQWDQARAPASARFLPTHVACHETLSTGTAVLLGDTILEPGGHHFFEVKLLTDLYGTDTMVGLVTDQFDPDSANQRFVSLLGADSHSWGLSFHGTIRHAGRSQPYTSLFGKGSIIGVYANLRAGTVEFFLNRRSLGVAFSGLSRPGDGGRSCRVITLASPEEEGEDEEEELHRLAGAPRTVLTIADGIPASDTGCDVIRDVTAVEADSIPASDAGCDVIRDVTAVEADRVPASDAGCDVIRDVTAVEADSVPASDAHCDAIDGVRSGMDGFAAVFSQVSVGELPVKLQQRKTNRESQESV
ncbi:uncharacterized protein LOC119095092 [Pollicipes pollicipes]|uniref:uncharacterized protein LOC119095092 n=1 Tax=Pollicipes pollicipes TaxID=41117 RepID=UPI001885396C|nr:uncharacterized protein LOC119095092 [Pollicipes pollicipes]